MIQGPGIFLAQFMSDQPPLSRFDTACKWAGDLGYVGVQVPSWDGRCIDLHKAATSKAYCDDLKGTARAHGVEISELSTHLQGQLVAVHPAYASMFQVFAPPQVDTPQAMCEYGSEQVRLCLKASEHLGLEAMVDGRVDVLAVLDRLLVDHVEQPPERVAHDRLPAVLAGEHVVVGELQPRQPVVVDACETDHGGRDLPLRIDTPLLAVEPEARDVALLEDLCLLGVRLTLHVDEALRTVGDRREHGVRIETEIAGDHRCGLTGRRDLLRVRIDGRRLLANGELDPVTVAVVENSLTQIDRAIRDARNALARDPASSFLTEQLNRALEKKLGVLRTAALLRARI